MQGSKSFTGLAPRHAHAGNLAACAVSGTTYRWVIPLKHDSQCTEANYYLCAARSFGPAIRAYVAHHLENERLNDEKVRIATRGVQRLKLLRAFVAWRSMVDVVAHQCGSVRKTPSWRRCPVVGVAEPNLWSNNNRWAHCRCLHGSIRVCAILDRQRFAGDPYDSCSLGFIASEVLARLGYTAPNISVGATELLFGTESEYDEEYGQGAYAHQLRRSLHDCDIANDTHCMHADDDNDSTLQHMLTISFKQDVKNTGGFEILTSPIDLLGYHRYCARREIQTVLQPPATPAQISIRFEQGRRLASEALYHIMGQTPPERYGCPWEAGVLWSKSQRKPKSGASKKLRQTGRLVALQSLDLSGTGVELDEIIKICFDARATLKTLKLDGCPAVDDLARAICKTTAAKSEQLKWMCELAASNSIDVSGGDEIVTVRVGGAFGVEFQFRLRCRQRLFRLMVAYAGAVRQTVGLEGAVAYGADQAFEFRYATNSNGGRVISVDGTETPRQLQMSKDSPNFLMAFTAWPGVR